MNEAWTAAGMKGTISHPIISQVRKKLGLTGNLRGNPKQPPRESSPQHAQNSRHTGKTSCSSLNANRHHQNVNEAEAGFEGQSAPGKTRVTVLPRQESSRSTTIPKATSKP